MSKPVQWKRPPARAVHGILLLDKPLGLSSNQALQKAKFLFRAEKAGHTGSLDPAASGMLPICFGDATKVTAFLLDADKTYEVEATLGSRRSTGDAEGEIVESAPVPDLSLQDWEVLAARFLGEQHQIPPMYSALKHQGQRLYKLARAGKEVEREPRRIVISELDILALDAQRLRFRVRCSKGTYIRTLVEDMAQAAGTLAFTSVLRRTSVEPFGNGHMFGLEELNAMDDADRGDLLLAPDIALAGWPRVDISLEAVRRLALGQRVPLEGLAENGLVRTYAPDGVFLGISEVRECRILAPKKLFQTIKNY